MAFLLVLFALPWVAAIVWIALRHGLEVVFPRDGTIPSAGDLMRRRSAAR
jgi:hypothetical protein